MGRLEISTSVDYFRGCWSYSGLVRWVDGGEEVGACLGCRFN